MELICGIDEAGRGPLAGPVTAAVVILPDSFPNHILKDSKQLSGKKRELAAEVIIKEAIDFGLGWVWHFEIDRINIHNASLLAMKRAYNQMTTKPDKIFIDGKFLPGLDADMTAVIGGDRLVHQIMAASILAKVARDRWMVRHSLIEPEYAFEKHKGYPTAEHRKLCLILGPSSIQRRSFTISFP